MDLKRRETAQFFSKKKGRYKKAIGRGGKAKGKVEH